MIFAKSHIDLHNIRNNVERVKKLSDNIVGVGPLGIGLQCSGYGVSTKRSSHAPIIVSSSRCAI